MELVAGWEWQGSWLLDVEDRLGCWRQIAQGGWLVYLYSTGHIWICGRLGNLPSAQCVGVLLQTKDGSLAWGAERR